MDHLNSDDLKKVAHVIELGVQSKLEIKTINESFKETIDEVSKELDISKKLLNAAIRTEFLAQTEGDRDSIIEEEQKRLDDVQYLLEMIRNSKRS